MHGDAEMGVGVIDDTQRLARADREAVSRFQGFGQPPRWVAIHAPVGEFPHPAEQSARGTLRQQHVGQIRNLPYNHRRGIDNMRNLRFGFQHGTRFLQSQFLRPTIPAQRTECATRILRQADGRAQIHQRLVEIAGFAFGQILRGEFP